MMSAVAVVRVMVVVVMVAILVIAALMEMLGSLVGLNVNMGNVIAGMAVPDSEAQPWCCRGIQKQAVAGSRGPENAAPAPSRFNPHCQPTWSPVLQVALLHTRELEPRGALD